QTSRRVVVPGARIVPRLSPTTVSDRQAFAAASVGKVFRMRFLSRALHTCAWYVGVQLQRASRSRPAPQVRAGGASIPGVGLAMPPAWFGGSECFARGGLFQPALELANRHQLLAAAADEAQLVRDVLGEELVADAEHRCRLGEGQREAGEGEWATLR